MDDKLKEKQKKLILDEITKCNERYKEDLKKLNLEIKKHESIPETLLNYQNFITHINQKYMDDLFFLLEAYENETISLDEVASKEAKLSTRITGEYLARYLKFLSGHDYKFYEKTITKSGKDVIVSFISQSENNDISNTEALRKKINTNEIILLDYPNINHLVSFDKGRLRIDIVVDNSSNSLSFDEILGDNNHYHMIDNHIIESLPIGLNLDFLFYKQCSNFLKKMENLSFNWDNAKQNKEILENFYTKHINNKQKIIKLKHSIIKEN